MKRLAALALVVAGVSFPLCAQRSGARGGFSGGHSSVGRSAPAFRSAPSFHGAPAFHGSGSFAFPSGHYGAFRGPISSASRPLSLSPAVHTQRPGFYNRRLGYTARFHDRRPYYGVGIPYVSGWVDPGY